MCMFYENETNKELAELQAEMDKDLADELGIKYHTGGFVSQEQLQKSVEEIKTLGSWYRTGSLPDVDSDFTGGFITLDKMLEAIDKIKALPDSGERLLTIPWAKISPSAMGFIGHFTGLPVIASAFLDRRVQFLTHRKKRINKKYRKKYGYITVPNDSVHYFVDNEMIIGSQSTVDSLFESLKVGD